MGNHSLAYGAALSRVQVVSAYPITPQTQVVELLSEFCADGTLAAEYINVESEHSAMAACIGASASGARAFTATSSQGLALMHELLHWAVGSRLPIVMGNINRAMGPPWNVPDFVSIGLSGERASMACFRRRACRSRASRIALSNVSPVGGNGLFTKSTAPLLNILRASAGLCAPWPVITITGGPSSPRRSRISLSRFSPF